MGHEQKAADEVARAYIDKLIPANVKGLLKAGISHIIVLEKVDKKQRKYVRALKRNGVEVEEPSFFAGHLKDNNGESIYLVARKLAGQVALEAAKLLVESDPLLKRLITLQERETLRLSLARSFMRHAEASILPVLAAQVLSRPQKANVWIEQPLFFDSAVLLKYLPGAELRFYSVPQSRILWVFRELVRDIGRRIKRLVGFGPYILRAQACEPSVLTMQEDTIRADRSLRGQPHWIDSRDGATSFRTYINLSPWYTIAEDAGELRKAGVNVVKLSTIRAAWRARTAVPALRRISQARRAIRRAVFFREGFAETAALLHTSKLLWEAERMGALATWLNVRVFLSAYNVLSVDAMQLVAPHLNVTTIAYQFSNLSFQTPVMMATCDYFVVFSPMFKKVFQAEGIHPRQWVIGGYPYDGVSEFVRSRAEKHRQALLGNGATFIICYLDESVQNDRWGLISERDHLEELHVLTKAVLDDAQLAVLVKPQFVRNLPSRLHPQDRLIQDAKATGRYIELAHEGILRNDIYPMEAALVADLCIGHKFGATAALEAAVAGVRSVLLNQQGLKTSWDHLYSKGEIEFESLELLMTAISDFRACNGKHDGLGDWGPILNEFDPFQDGKATTRLRNLIEQCLN